MATAESVPAGEARRRNPFNPTTPIEPSYFGGRYEELEIILRSLNQTRHGSQTNLLITGERGIGKSSLALWTRYIAERPNPLLSTECKFIAAFYTLDDNEKIPDFCQGTIEKLNKQIGRTLPDRFFEKLRQWDCSIKLNFWLGSTELGTNKVNKSEGEPARVRRDYVNLLEALWDELAEQGYNGIIIIIDELNKIHEKENLGAFFKKVSEDLISDGYRNIMFVLVGLPWLEEKFAADDQSSVRIFKHVALGPMSPKEVSEVINKALKDTGISMDEKARETLAHYSGGYPYFLQQMCFDSFEANTDGVVDTSDVQAGILNSLVQFERAFFGRLLRDVEGKNYQKLIEALASSSGADGMKASELQKLSEVKGAAQYLPKLLKDGVITSPKKGHYKLASNAFALYVNIKTLAKAVDSVSKGLAANKTVPTSPPSSS